MQSLGERITRAITMAKNLKKLIGDYLTEAKMMCLATSKGNKPWTCTLWYVHDNNWNLYFISRKNRRHSLELKENQNVAGVIVKPHLKGSGEKVAGIQFEGTAKECNLLELAKALALYLKKYPIAEKIPLKLLQNISTPFTFYIIKPSSIVLFDEINFPEEPRQEMKL